MLHQTMQLTLLRVLQLQLANEMRLVTTQVEHIAIIMNLTYVTRDNTASWIMEASGNLTIFVQLQYKTMSWT